MEIKIVPSVAKINKGGKVTLVASVYKNEVPIGAKDFNNKLKLGWRVIPDGTLTYKEKNTIAIWDTSNVPEGIYAIRVELKQEDNVKAEDVCSIQVYKELGSMDIVSIPPVDISTKRYETEAQALNVAIRNRTEAIRFDEYSKFLEQIAKDIVPQTETLINNTISTIQKNSQTLNKYSDGLEKPFFKGMYAYGALKLATQIFLILHNCGLEIGDGYDKEDEGHRLGREVSKENIREELKRYLGENVRLLPYFEQILQNLFGSGYLNELDLNKLLSYRVKYPCMIELIWSYWHEEGMLSQTMNAISLRFQNKKVPSARSPLANMTIDSIRSLGPLIWDHIRTSTIGFPSSAGHMNMITSTG